MNHNVYVYPMLGGVDLFGFRLLGPGLGNLLFPWARALVLARDINRPLIWPTWAQFKLGPVIRCEPDLRFYTDLFSPTARYVIGVRRLVLLAACSRISEHEASMVSIDGSRSKMVVIEGLDSYFSSILNDHDYVLQELVSITRQKHKAYLQFDYLDSISVHVRLGDFAKISDTALLENGNSNCRIPIEWYVSMIEKVRLSVGKKMRVLLFSDGKDEDLLPITSIDNVERVSFGSSVADLLALSRSKLLIASGSTFSMWGSYLGRMPVIWHPGQMRQRLYINQPELEVECGMNDSLTEVFCRALQKLL